jgi:NAD(P)-dependent dehydrogenase (short-subunit alcohol dehydrogenase family)
MQTALVTGANKGIGLGLARALAQKGFRVFLGVRDEEKGRAAQQQLAEEGLTVEVLSLDVSKEESIRGAVQQLASQIDHLDVLVNNAGIFGGHDGQSALTIPAERVLEVFETNALGPLLLSQQLVPLLKKSPAGKIINISSGLGQLSSMDGSYAAYRISKTALNAVTRMLAAELRPAGVTVNSVCPGWVRTDMGGEHAERSIEESVAGILPLLVEQTRFNGAFLRDAQPIAW